MLQTSHWDARKLALISNYQSDVFVDEAKPHKNNQQIKLRKDQQVDLEMGFRVVFNLYIF